MSSFFSEIKRRNVFRVGAAYLIFGWITLQIIDVIVEPLNLPDWTATLIIVLLAIGFPVALILAWAFELTPDGVKRSNEVDPEASVTSRTGRKIDFLIIGALGLAVVFLLFDKFSGDTPTGTAPAEATAEATPTVAPATTNRMSVAVLPFVNMSSDPEQEYFSDGITEEILNVLVRIKGLRVPSRTSSFAFKGRNLSIKKVAEELQVDHILEGSIRKSGNQIRITAQLIDVKTDTHLWSETYDREYKDIFKVQDEIAKAIVGALKETLGVEMATVSVEAPTDNIEAYDLFLKAREYFMTRNVILMSEAIGIFERAIALDPNFAEAHEGLAGLYLVLPAYDPNHPFKETYDKADSLARQALSIDPTLALAHSIVGQIHGYYHRWNEADAAYDLAHQFGADNPTVRLWRGLYLDRLGYLEKAHDELVAGLKADPASGILNAYLATSLLQQKKAQEALPYSEKALGLGWPYAYVMLSYTHLALGDIAEAKRIRQTQSIAPEDRVLGGVMLDLLTNPGERDANRKKLQKLAAENGINLKIYFENTIWPIIEAGDFEAAADLMLRRDTALQFSWLPFYQEYRQSAAFKDMLRRAGIVDYWKANGWPKQCRQLAGDDFECD